MWIILHETSDKHNELLLRINVNHIAYYRPAIAEDFTVFTEIILSGCGGVQNGAVAVSETASQIDEMISKAMSEAGK